MNALGITYLVLFGVAMVLACTHIAQAVLIRSDRSQPLLAVLCLGFGLFDLGVAFSSEYGGAAQPTWIGWHLLAASCAAMLTVVVPMVAWTLLELKLNAVRVGLIVVTVLLGLARLIGVSVLLRGSEVMTWERLHSLDHSLVAIPSVLSALMGAVVWAVEGGLAARRGIRYALPMALFGCVATVASLHGVGVTLGLAPPPDLFGLLTLPVLSFVQVLSAVRFVQALQTANQPAGEMARYEVLRKLGQGGMGEIFLARRKGPAGFLRQVVLKTLKKAGDAVSKDRFLVEARLAAQLRHPNIVDVYDLGEQPDGFFIVMEHIAGVTLDELLDRAIDQEKPIPADVVAELGAQMCRALSFAHAAGVIHRDTKRQNVMVSFNGVLKLIDFGIAQEVLAPIEQRVTAEASAEVVTAEGLTQEGGVVGTHGYISPERYLGDPATVASDLFAVGVVLYELLAMRSPFQAKAAEAFIAAANVRGFVRLRAAREDASTGLTEAIEKCLEPTPATRPVSAASLQVMLEGSLEGRRVDLVSWLAELFPSGAATVVKKTERAPSALSTETALRQEVLTTPMRKPRK